ncbi:MAG: hypothetical protein ACOY46_17135 [Bacillota bacterium]
MANSNDLSSQEGKNSKTAGVVYLDQYRWRKAGQILRRKLGEFAVDSFFSNDISRAQQLYLVGLNPDIVDENEEMIMERCFEWFIFDYVTEGGMTPIEVMAEQKKLPENEQSLIEDWKNSRLSVFEVKGMDTRRGIRIKDLLQNREFWVSNFDFSGEIEEGSVIYMRVLRVGKEYEFSTGGFGLPPECGGPLLEKIRADAGRYSSKKGRGRFILNKYLRERAHIINTWVLDFAHRIYNDGMDIEKDGCSPFIPGTQEKPSSKLAQHITDLFLDDYYEKWIKEPSQTLDGKTPKESCKTVHGRAKVEELLKELEEVERKRAKKGEPHYDINKVRSRLGLIKGDSIVKNSAFKDKDEEKEPFWETFRWPGKAHARIAFLVMDYFKSKNYSFDQMTGALKLWFDYCVKENPKVRKEQLWVAAVVYAFSRLECDSTVNQQGLAREFDISVSGLSEKFRSMCRSLDLMVLDRRYTSAKSPIEGLELSDPLLAKIFYNLKL